MKVKLSQGQTFQILILEVSSHNCVILSLAFYEKQFEIICIAFYHHCNYISILMNFIFINMWILHQCIAIKSMYNGMKISLFIISSWNSNAWSFCRRSSTNCSHCRSRSLSVLLAAIDSTPSLCLNALFD
jgi:hypothetical protein